MPAPPPSTRIDRRKYLPAPKVDGAVVAFDLLAPRQRLAVPSEAQFLKLVRAGRRHVLPRGWGPARWLPRACILHRWPGLASPQRRDACRRAPPTCWQVKKAFSQRRKVVRNSLRPLWEPADVAAALRAAGLNEDARAQDLTLAEFGALAWALPQQAGGSGPDGGSADAAQAEADDADDL